MREEVRERGRQGGRKKERDPSFPKTECQLKHRAQNNARQSNVASLLSLTSVQGLSFVQNRHVVQRKNHYKWRRAKK